MIDLLAIADQDMTLLGLPSEIPRGNQRGDRYTRPNAQETTDEYAPGDLLSMRTAWEEMVKQRLRLPKQQQRNH